MSQSDYFIGFFSSKFSHGILTTWTAVMFGSLIQKRKGKLNYIFFFLQRISLYELYPFQWEKIQNKVFFVCFLKTFHFILEYSQLIML